MRRWMLAVSAVVAMAPQIALADALSDGIDLVKKGDYERAVTVLRQAAAANPADPRPYQYLEKAYEATYRITDAIDAHATYLALREKAAKAKPAAKASAEPDALPPVYVRPGPRTHLPPITNDLIPRTPTVWRATPVDLPKAVGSDADAKATAGSDAAAKGTAVAPPALPTPSAEPTPPPILEPINEPTGFNAPPVNVPGMPGT